MDENIYVSVLWYSDTDVAFVLYYCVYSVHTKRVVVLRLKICISISPWYVLLNYNVMLITINIIESKRLNLIL